MSITNQIPTPVVSYDAEDLADGKLVAFDASGNDVAVVCSVAGASPPAELKYCLQFSGGGPVDDATAFPRGTTIAHGPADIVGIKQAGVMPIPPKDLQTVTTLGAMALGQYAWQSGSPLRLWRKVQVWDGVSVVDPGVDDTKVMTDPGVGFCWAFEIGGDGEVKKVSCEIAATLPEPTVIVFGRLQGA